MTTRSQQPKKPRPPVAAPVARVMYECRTMSGLFFKRRHYPTDTPVLVIDLSRREEVVEVMREALELSCDEGDAQAALSALEQLARRKGK